MSATFTADAPASGNGAPPRPTAVRRRRPLPSGRAAAGGLLVTLAALGTYLAASGPDEAPRSSFVVATRSIDVGDQLRAADLRIVHGDLPDDVLGATYADPTALDGAVALVPLDAGTLVESSDVRLSPVDSSGLDARPELSLRLPRAQAIDGDLVRGEPVDVLATYGSGPDAVTQVIARAATITRIGGEAGPSLGDDGGVTVTLRLPDDATVLRAVHAKDVATVTLVRSRSIESTPGDREERYAGPGTADGDDDHAAAVTDLEGDG